MAIIGVEGKELEAILGMVPIELDFEMDIELRCLLSWEDYSCLRGRNGPWFRLVEFEAIMKEIKEVVIHLILEFRVKDSNIYLRNFGRIK